jgi:protein polybromo-1
VELEQWFVKERDELCRSTLLSPALSYTLEDVQKDVDSERKDKLAHEVEERKMQTLRRLQRTER